MDAVLAHLHSSILSVRSKPRDSQVFNKLTELLGLIVSHLLVKDCVCLIHVFGE